MVKIRLMRTGKKKRASYRVVVANATSPRDGRIIESIGHYQPRADPSVIVIDNDRAVYWLRQGAQPSQPVRKLLDISGAWGEFSGRPRVTAASTAGSTPEAEVSPAAPRATPAASVAEGGEEGSSEE
ncbi:MAG: 30S ribosomal protein S16 [Actinobacteria bacterium]|jgi:small subunit ribosomal protein S16|nr:30S ribosomal protein S16 [Actinomycetota bacterium]MDQ3217687.1 30S ribosomal protein S16 [Actinomycetota bacterium]